VASKTPTVPKNVPVIGAGPVNVPVAWSNDNTQSPFETKLQRNGGIPPVVCTTRDLLVILPGLIEQLEGE
jgi:hypothetical protein